MKSYEIEIRAGHRLTGPAVNAVYHRETTIVIFVPNDEPGQIKESGPTVKDRALKLASDLYVTKVDHEFLVTFETGRPKAVENLTKAVDALKAFCGSIEIEGVVYVKRRQGEDKLVEPAIDRIFVKAKEGSKIRIVQMDWTSSTSASEVADAIMHRF